MLAQKELPLATIKQLVGPGITREQLKYVDCYVGKRIGLFMPSVGHCGYAITVGHTHPAYSYVIFPTGAKGIISYTAAAGPDQYEAAMLPPDYPHEERAEDSFLRYFAIFIAPELAAQLFAAYGYQPQAAEQEQWRHGVWSGFGVAKSIMQLLSRFMEECEQEGSGAELAVEALELLIANELVRSQVAEQEPTFSAGAGMVGLQTVIDYLHQHYQKPVSVKQLAALASMGESTFTRHFREATGLTPASYLIQLRLKKACKLILTDQFSLTEVALKCGFSSAAHFTATFRKELAVTPSEYRRQWFGGNV